MNAFKRIALVALILLAVNMGNNYVKAAAMSSGYFFLCDKQEQMELYLENIFIGDMTSKESIADLGTKEGGMAVCGTNTWMFEMVGEVNRLPDIGDGYLINEVLVYGYSTDSGRIVMMGLPVTGFGYEVIEEE